MRLPFVTLVLFAALPLGAQGVAAPSGAVLQPPTSFNCPVQFTATRNGSELRRAGSPDGKVLPPGSFLLQLHFADQDTGRIVALSGVLHGSGVRQHVLTAASGTAAAQSAQPREDRPLQQSFQLLSPSASGPWQTRVAGLPVLREVDLTEIHFKDGTVWHSSPEARCRVAPGGMMLVAGGR